MSSATSIMAVKAVCRSVAEALAPVRSSSETVNMADVYKRQGGTLTVEMPLFGNFESQTWRLQRALEELSARNGTVSGTLHLPSEGNKAWLLAKRWMPGDEMESSPTGEGENAVAPAPET